jgi:hypothetical protein
MGGGVKREYLKDKIIELATNKTKNKEINDMYRGVN